MGGRGGGGGRGLNFSNSYAGEYSVFRSGDLSGASTGVVFFSAGDRQDAILHTEDYSGRYGRKGLYSEYSIRLKNPLVVEAVDDDYAAITTYNKLHNTNFRGMDDVGEHMKSLGIKKRGLDARQMFLDRENGKALSKTKYDGIIYRTRVVHKSSDSGTYIQIDKNYHTNQIIVSADKAKSAKHIAEYKRRRKRK